MTDNIDNTNPDYDDDELQNEEAAFEESMQTEEAPYGELSEFIAKATGYGLYPIVAHGLDPGGKPSSLAVATSPIPDLPISLDLVERSAKIKMARPYLPGMFIPIGLLYTIVDKNRIMSYHEKEIKGLDSNNEDHRKAIRHLVAFCTASRWTNRAFVLVDIVGFSKASTEEQLALRMSLGQSINQVCYRMYDLHMKQCVLKPNFNRLSTGDGFYFFNWYNKSGAHITSFLFMLLLMAQTEALFERTKLRLRAAFVIGEAYTFPYRGPGLFPDMDPETTFMPEAIGPALNDLQRLLSVASPGQILAQHFDEPGRPERTNERLDISTMLTRIRSEILPCELSVSDHVKSQDIIIKCDPSDKPLRVTDKHNIVHHCYNVWGRIPVWPEEGVHLQTVGLITDNSNEVSVSNFRHPDCP